MRALAPCQQSQDHAVAPCYVDLVHKGRLRVWADGRRRNTASVSRHARDSRLKGAPRWERVGMGRYNKHRGGPLGLGHNPVGNYDLVLVDSHVRSPRCVRRSC